MSDKKRIGVIFGGRSGEHEVSLLSAASVIRAINKEKYDLAYVGITREGEWLRYEGPVEAIESGHWNRPEYTVPFQFGEIREIMDFALPIVHGPYCEDGRLQGLLEMLDIPYGGCGVLASAAAMDKATAKDLFIQHGIPVCRHIFVTREQIEKSAPQIAMEVEATVGYPCFVKPANMGSSVGISRATDYTTLMAALEEAVKYDKRIIIEENVNCRELETAVVGNIYPRVGAVGEIVSASDFYDYKAKYVDGKSVMCIPADIPQDLYREIQQLAIKAYKAIDGEGYARVDFFLDRDTGKLYLNEINTIPGFTKYSMFPLLWKEAGLEYDKLLERIIELGYERYYAKNNR